MANNRRKSAAIALAIVGIAGLSLASASTLNITPGTLQAGTEPLVDCQTADVEVTYGFAFDGTQYVANSVTVSNIAEGCRGGVLGVTLRAGGATTTIANTAIPAGTGVYSTGAVALTTPISAEALSDVDVAISR